VNANPAGVTIEAREYFFPASARKPVLGRDKPFGPESYNLKALERLKAEGLAPSSELRRIFASYQRLKYSNADK